MTDGEAADMREAIESLTARVRRLERRLSDLEPETMPGVVEATPAGVRSVPAPAPAPRETPNAIDAFGDLLERFGLGDD